MTATDIAMLEKLAGLKQEGRFEYERNENYDSRKGSPIQGHVVRFKPNPRKNADGSTSYGWNFPALVASDMLAEAEAVMRDVADQLNACPVLAAELLTLRRPAEAARADVPWQWWAGRDDENFSFGPCNTREEAIRLAVEDGMCEESSADDPEVWENHIHLIEAQQAPLRLADWIGTDTLLERADEAVADSDRVCYEHDDGPWFEATTEQEADLAARLRRACDEWQTAHGLTFTCRTFSASCNAEFVIVPQLRELLPAPTAEGGNA
ncbi:hypothetical protein [Paracoccus simplex]|uniref:Uncharacterized protein n=1 Tax=Paracoccus simplex TaxID=2086346 RepID=A0ABV7S113_9RHOB